MVNALEAIKKMLEIENTVEKKQSQCGALIGEIFYYAMYSPDQWISADIRN